MCVRKYLQLTLMIAKFAVHAGKCQAVKTVATYTNQVLLSIYVTIASKQIIYSNYSHALSTNGFVRFCYSFMTDL